MRPACKTPSLAAAFHLHSSTFVTAGSHLTTEDNHLNYQPSIKGKDKDLSNADGLKQSMNMSGTVVNRLTTNPRADRSVSRLAAIVAMALIALPGIGMGQNYAIPATGPAPCTRISKSFDFLFIAYGYEKEINGRKTVVLRLHNNSTCAVWITSGTAKSFEKPLPPNPTIMQRLKREIEYELPTDNELVPDVQYKYDADGRERNSIGGDEMFGFYLLPRRSILFEVPIRHLGEPGVGNKIVVPFQYEWELKDQTGNIYPSVESRVEFWTDSLPNHVKIRLKRHLANKKTRTRAS